MPRARRLSATAMARPVVCVGEDRPGSCPTSSCFRHPGDRRRCAGGRCPARFEQNRCSRIHITAPELLRHGRCSLDGSTAICRSEGRAEAALMTSLDRAHRAERIRSTSLFRFRCRDFSRDAILPPKHLPGLIFRYGRETRLSLSIQKYVCSQCLEEGLCETLPESGRGAQVTLLRYRGRDPKPEFQHAGRTRAQHHRDRVSGLEDSGFRARFQSFHSRCSRLSRRLVCQSGL
jgi:hypothetical protein